MKKFLSLMLAVLLILSAVAVSVSAEEIEAENPYVLHFDANTVDSLWVYKYKKVYCHIWMII